ncbi:hypothetical protein OsI_20664 [Oryza sativa Indica Group]|uniref:F-box domain-containing protein n=1 Tax=Oryza sativa subsp. indica TaxID=39946 RepID=A2Y6M3_ORYSI|nr:hypothetical protein OsI_20664 [Oryza sativa Indica Group]
MMRDSKRTRSAPPREPLEMTEDMTPRSKRRKFVPFGEGAVLPEEMLTEVFLRLPIKSILRFRAACHSRYAMLSSQEFCQLYITRTEAMPPQPKLLFISPTANFNSTAVYTCSPSKPIDDLLFTLDDVRGNYVEVAPSPCHGLTLLYNAVAPAYYVFNATTRAITRLPPYQDVIHATAGVGFDARTKEFKVVRLFRGKSHEIHSVKCEIFILGGEEGDHWRPTAGGVPFRFCSFALSAIRNAVANKLQPVFVNGFLHWLINPSFLLKAPRAAIISFSLTDETFRWIRSPPFEVSRVHLAELDDQLCMVRDLRNGLPTGNLPRDLLEPRIVKVIGSFGSYRSSKKIIIATSKHKTCSAYQNEKSDIRFSSFTKSFTPVHRTRKEIGFSTPLSKATKEILLRLPAESILKLELVCKQWRGLIKNEGFVHAYFEHKNMDRRPKIMLVGKGSEKSVFNFIPLSKWLQEANLGTMFLDKKVVCSKPCHGLNLVSIEMKDYLFNPCTGYRMIYWNRDHQLYQEWSNLSSDRCKDYNPFVVGNKNVGMGFCQVTQSHAVVGIFYYWKNYESRQYYLTCFMWSCSSQGQPLPDPPLPVNDMPPVSLDGVLYWMSEPRLGQSYERAIVFFNIAAKIFDVIPCPSCIAIWDSRNPCHAFVVELQGMLCAVLSNPVADKLDIWKWDHGLWSIAYAINLKFWPDYSLATNVVVPLAVDPIDGKVLLNTGRKLGLYNPCKQTIENLLALDQASQQQNPGVNRNFHIARCQDVPKKFSQWKLSLAPCEKFANPSSASSGKNPFYSRDQSKELNSVSQKIMPLVPMLYEEGLAYYPTTPKLRVLCD